MWEPNDAEIGAYQKAAKAEGWERAAPSIERADKITAAGLRAAYALLEERVANGEVLGQTVDLPPILMEYRDAYYFADVQTLSADGWRLHTATYIGAGDGWSYLLERVRPDQ